MKLVLKIGALLLCAVVLVVLLPACAEKNDPFAITGLSSLTIEKNDTVRAVVSLNLTQAEAHANESAYIYELLPGEDLTSLGGKEALDEAKVGTNMTFEFSLRDGDRTRLYSTFAVCYENGLLLLDAAYPIGNPETLASCTTSFRGGASPKGLAISDVESAVGLGVSHAMFDVNAAAFDNGSGTTYQFDGKEYSVSAVALSALDRRVTTACLAGMQVSLRMIFDSSVSRENSVALLDFLTARYDGEEYGTVTALFVDAEGAENAAELSFYARTALISHVRNGRVYVVCKDKTASGASEFLKNVSTRIAQFGAFRWGVALDSICTNVLPWEPSAEDALDLLSLSDFYKETYSYDHPPIYLAICNLKFDEEDENGQAASVAYAYAKSVEAGADLIYYGAQNGDGGLFTAAGTERLAADMYRRIDIGLSSEQIYLCKSVSVDAWNTIESLRASRKILTGNGSTGFGVGEQKNLFDFTSGETFGFAAVGGLSEPQSRDSAAWGKPVLYTWLNAAQEQTGVRKMMENGLRLKDATALTLQLLAQYDIAEPCVLTLCLSGMDENGAAVSYESSIKFEGKKWQTATFDISEFVASADLSQECVLTVFCKPTTDTDENFVLFLKGVYAYYPQGGTTMILPIVLVAVGAVLGFALIVVLYLRARVHKRKRG